MEIFNGKYNWTIASIEERLQRLNVILNNETDPNKIEMLRSDITILQDYIDDYYNEEEEEKLKHDFTTNKALKAGAKIACGVHPEEIEDILQDPDVGGEIYLTSYMLALELYKIFREDKEKALYYLRKFILMECYTEEEYYSNIKRFGTSPNLSTREMHQEFQNEAMRLTRKKKKPKHN